MSDHQISLNESIGMFEISRSVKPWNHLKDEVVAPMVDAAKKYAHPDYEAGAIAERAYTTGEHSWVLLTPLEHETKIKRITVAVDAALGVTEDE